MEPETGRVKWTLSFTQQSFEKEVKFGVQGCIANMKQLDIDFVSWISWIMFFLVTSMLLLDLK